MTDNVQIRFHPANQDEFIITRVKSGERLTLSRRHIINLARELPNFVRHILKGSKKEESPNFSTVTTIRIRRTKVRHDIIGESVLIFIEDQFRLETIYQLPLSSARALAGALISAAERGESVATGKPQ